MRLAERSAASAHPLVARLRRLRTRRRTATARHGGGGWKETEETDPRGRTLADSTHAPTPRQADHAPVPPGRGAEAVSAYAPLFGWLRESGIPADTRPSPPSPPRETRSPRPSPPVITWRLAPPRPWKPPSRRRSTTLRRIGDHAPARVPAPRSPRQASRGAVTRKKRVPMKVPRARPAASPPRRQRRPAGRRARTPAWWSPSLPHREARPACSGGRPVRPSS